MTMNWEKYGIDVTKLRGGKMQCPQCSAGRKNKTDKPLSVDLEKGFFNCHNCGFKGCAAEVVKERKEWVAPPPRLQKLGDKAQRFFENDRKISNNTLLRFGITEAKEWMPQHEKEVDCICFNYFRNEKLINIKFRGPKKAFKMVSGAELIFYNLDSIKGEKECIITEGEIDCLTMYEAGFYSCVSVPNGASKGNQKLEYLDNCWEYFEAMEKVILAVDGDGPGIALRDELARRLGFEKVYTVDYPEGCKDANDVLVKFGVQAVKDLVAAAEPWPIPGIVSTDSLLPTVDDWFQNGYPTGARSHIEGFDDLLTFAPGHITTITGIPGHGKDEFMNWVMVNLARYNGWNLGICGFEESPAETITKLMEKYTGKSFAKRDQLFMRMTTDQYNEALVFVDDHFSLVNPDDITPDVDSLLSIATQLVKSRGIKGFYINPWNWIEHNRKESSSESEYVSAVYSKLVRWARKYQCHVFMVAHTTKMTTDKNGKFVIPTLYSISGSANFYNKTSNGITVYQDRDKQLVEVYVQKVKQSWYGRRGWVAFRFDVGTRQYSFASIDNPSTKSKPVELPEGSWKSLGQQEKLFI